MARKKDNTEKFLTGITTEANAASKALDKLSTSLTGLSKVSGSIQDPVSQICEGLSNLTKHLTAVNKIPSPGKGLKDKFAELKSLLGELRPFRDAGLIKNIENLPATITALADGLHKMSINPGGNTSSSTILDIKDNLDKLTPVIQTFLDNAKEVYNSVKYLYDALKWLTDKESWVQVQSSIRGLANSFGILKDFIVALKEFNGTSITQFINDFTQIDFTNVSSVLQSFSTSTSGLQEASSRIFGLRNALFKLGGTLSALIKLNKGIGEANKVINDFVNNMPTASSVTKSVDAITSRTKQLEAIFPAIQKSSELALTAYKGLSEFKSLEGVLPTIKTAVPALLSSLIFINQLPTYGAKEVKQYEKLASHITHLVKALEPLRNFKSSFPQLSKALSSLFVPTIPVFDGDIIVDYKARIHEIINVFDELKGSGYERINAGVKSFVAALEPLTGLKSTVGNTLNALSKITSIIDQIKLLTLPKGDKFLPTNALQSFKAGVLGLTDSLKPFNDISTTGGNTIKQVITLLDSVSVTKNVSSEDISSFTTKLDSLVKAIMPLATMPSLKIKPIANHITSLFSVIDATSNKDGAVTKFVNTIRVLTKPIENLAGISSKGGFSSFSKGIGSVIDASRAITSIPQESIDRLINFLRSLAGVLTLFAESKPYAIKTAAKSLVDISGAVKSITKLGGNEINNFLKTVEKLTQGLTPLGQAVEPLAVVLREYNREVGKAVVSTDKFRRSNSRLKGTLRQFVGGFGIIFSFRTLSRIMSDSFEISNDYIENLNVIAVSFGNLSEEVLKTSNRMQELLGIDPSEFMRNWGEVNLQLKGFGLDPSVTKEMSQNLTQLSYDLASLYNVDFETAMTKIKSGMSGMSRPLKIWGLDIGETAIQEFALSKGIDKTTKSMTQAEKAMLRYALLLERTSAAQGDFARTLDTPANNLRIIKEQVNQLKRAIGDFLSPTVAQALPYVRAFLEAFTEMFTRVANFSARLHGYKAPGLDSYLQSISDNAADAEEEISNLEDTMGRLTQFDKFNVLQDSGSKELGGPSFSLEQLGISEYSNFTKGAEELDKEVEKLKGNFTAILGTVEAILKTLEVVASLFGGIEGLANTAMFIGGYLLVKKVFNPVQKALVNTQISIHQVEKTSRRTANQVEKDARRAAQQAELAAKEAAVQMQMAFAQITFTAGIMLLFEAINAWSDEDAPLVKKILLTLAAAGTLFVSVLQFMQLGAFKTAKTLVTNLVSSLKKTSAATAAASGQVKAYTASWVGLAFAISAAVIGLSLFIANFSEMGTLARILVPLVAVITGLAAAVIAVKVAQAGWAAALKAGLIAGGIALAAGSMVATVNSSQSAVMKADGGYVGPGTRFIAGEKGPEWVGRQGNTSTIVNDTQMSDIMYDAVRDGVYDALMAVPDNKSTQSINLEFDSDKFIRVKTGAIMKEAIRQNYNIQKRGV